MGTTPADFDEAKRCRRIGGVGLLLGVLSGPLAFAAACMADSLHVSLRVGEEWSGSTLVAVGALVLIQAVQIGMLVHLTIRGGPHKGKRLVMVGIVLTYIWSFLIYLLMRLATYWAGC